jgi:peptidoglycan/xylan/chitin deacetylase (PgdA/CDA1 family)
MTELIRSLKNKKEIRKCVVLTFDDGFRNVVTNAYPIMKDLNAKGCFYVVSDLVGTNELVWTDYVETVIRNQPPGDFQFVFKGETIHYPLNDKISAEHAMRDIKKKLRSIPDKERLEHLEQLKKYQLESVPEEFRMVSWTQLKELDPNILETGGHTRSHPDCENLVTDAELEREILHSKLDIEKNTGTKVSHFCYPAGSYNDNVVDKVREYGYESAVTTNLGFVDTHADRFQLNRITAENNLLRFKATISGSYRYIRRII